MPPPAALRLACVLPRLRSGAPHRRGEVSPEKGEEKEVTEEEEEKEEKEEEENKEEEEEEEEGSEHMHGPPASLLDLRLSLSVYHKYRRDDKSGQK